MAKFNRPGSTPVQPRRPDTGRTGDWNSGNKRMESGGVMGAAGETAKDLASTAQEWAGKAEEQMQQWASGASHDAQDAWDNVSGWVRRNPVPTLLIVAGVGLAVGLVFATSSYASSSERRW